MDFLKRGPIWDTDSDGETPRYLDGKDPEARKNYLTGVRSWRESAREEAYRTAELNPEKDDALKYMNALGGRWWDHRRARYKSKVFDNRMNNSRQTDLSLLTQIRPTIDISSKIDAYKEQANIVSQVIRSEWLTRDMDMEFIRLNDIAKLNGTAFWKMGASYPGMTQTLSLGPESVLPIQPGFHIQQSTAVMYRTWKSMTQIRKRFPYTSEGIENDASFLDSGYGNQTRYARPYDIPEYTWNGMSQAMRRSLGVRTSSSEMTGPSIFQALEIQEFYIDDPSINESSQNVLVRDPYMSLKSYNWWYWVKPGQPLYPRKRMMVFCGHRLLYDGPSPFWHGMYPFACLRLNPVPWSFWGYSKYRDLLPLNQAMNEILAGILDMVRRALNPTVITKAGAVPQATWREFYPDMPGARLYMLPNSNPSLDVKYIDPPNIPAWVMQAHQYCSSEFDRLAGILDPTSMGKKKQVPGGDTIEQMREMMNTVTQLESRYGELFLRDAGVLAMSNIFQFFETPMRLKLLGANGISLEDFNYNGPSLIPDNVPKEDHWKSFAMLISPGTLLGSSRDREKQTAIGMAAKHLLPLQKLWQIIEAGDPKQLLEMMKQEAEMGVTGKTSATRLNRGQRNGGV